MTIQMDDTIRAIVYQKFCDNGDFMSAIMEVDGKTTARGRIRWYREDTGDPFRDRDEKHWGDIAEKHRGKPVEEMLKVIEDTLDQLVMVAEFSGQRKRPEKRYVLRRKEDETLEKFMDRFSEMPWVHKKEEKVH